MFMSNKPKPIPVKVPWRVSLSTPFLQLTVGEAPSDCPTTVSFLAYCPSWISLSPGSSNLINMPTDQELVGTKESGDCIVKLFFEPGGCARMYRSYADLEVVQESLYDWSALKYYFKADPDFENWGEDMAREFEDMARECAERSMEEWRRTSICPDPGMYEIENSPWLRELNFPEDRHFLILGHDAYVEVLAEDWKWEYEVV